MLQNKVKFMVARRQPAYIIESAVDFTYASGIVFKKKDENGQLAKIVHAPFTLYPSFMERKSLKLLKDIQLHLNKLVYAISQDQKFLTESLQVVAKADDFTQKLLDIYKLVKSRNVQVAELACMRSDYMFDFDSQSQKSVPKQIEINTIAASFFGIGTSKMEKLHRGVLTWSGFHDLGDVLPENETCPNVAVVFERAWNLYGKENAIILFLINDDEGNVFDQRNLEYEINKINPKIKIRRKIFSKIHQTLKLDEDRRLTVDLEEVAVVYFRVAYMPEHYPSKNEWKVREDIELSRAFKCPSVGMQLVGAKKMQEVLARPGVLERFLEPTIAEKVRMTFAGLYTLDMDEEGNATVEKALQHPEKYVLKPQREGGGNNLYGEEMKQCLNEIGSDERRTSYILMDMVRPRPAPNHIVSNGQSKPAEIVSELGIYGVYIAHGDKMIDSSTAGHLLRSKSKEHDDGGVSAGVAVLDSPFLTVG